MANNIANILPPSCIRLCVEPVQVELENGDNSLLFSSLQSAFPNSTGIYFRPTRANSANQSQLGQTADCCRVMLKFDGRRFLPPAGGWNGTIDYFVELSGSRHTSFPFGSYEQASRQFERSVNLVQQMMNGSGVGMKPKNWRAADANGSRKGSMDQELRLPSPQQSVRNLEQSDELDGRQPQEKNYTQVELMTRELSARQLKSLERDFADLARICAGKDAVIDGQRAELDQSRLELDRLRAGQQEWADKEAEWKAKLESSQAELSMLRDLGRDQESLHGRIEELSQQLEAEQNAREGQRRQLELELHKCQREAHEWKEKSELGTWTVSELTEQLKKAQREKADLQRKAAILEEQVNGEAMEFGRRFQERERVQQELLADNTRLYQIKDQLELQCRELGERLTGLEVQFAKRMDIFRMESEAKEEKLRENLLAADSRLLQMEMANRELAAAKAEAMEQLRRLRNPSAEDLGDQSQLFAYSQEG